jgi:hypothetical protein
MDARQRINQRRRLKGKSGAGGALDGGRGSTGGGSVGGRTRGPQKVHDLRALIGNKRSPGAAAKSSAKSSAKPSIKNRLGFTSKSRAAAIAAATVTAGRQERLRTQRLVGQINESVANERLGAIPRVTIKTMGILSGARNGTRNGSTLASLSRDELMEEDDDDRPTAASRRPPTHNRVWVRQEMPDPRNYPIIIPQLMPQTSVPTVIFASPGNYTPTTVQGQAMDTSGLGARANGNSLVVSNLNPLVTNQDIMELFGDIGTVAGLQMINPNTALVTYRKNDDAAKAVETYHNRLLDGLPMQCTLIPSPPTPGSGHSSNSVAFANHYVPTPVTAGPSSGSVSASSSRRQTVAQNKWSSKKDVQFVVKI